MTGAEKALIDYTRGAGHYPSHHMIFDELFSFAKARGVAPAEMKATAEKWQRIVWIREQPGDGVFSITQEGHVHAEVVSPAP